jgi:GxxExxY protein
LIDNDLIVEIKAVERLVAAHEAQLLTYLRMSGCQVGLLLNFNAVRLKDGMRRLVRSHETELA